MRVAGVLLLLPLLFLAFACRNRSGDDVVPDGYRNTGPDAQYVGIDGCKDCHKAQYDTYIQTGMGRSFRAATLSNSDARWEGIRPLYDRENDLYYLPFHRGEDLFVMEYRLAGRDTVHRRVEKIDYIVGSGHHTNSHMYEVNGYVYQIPITWYAQEQKWDLPPGFEGKNTRFDREIPLECMTCHNARPEYIQGSWNRYTRVPHGIDCEQCHGPGSVHVAQMRAGKVVDTRYVIDYTIVNPRKLALDRQYDICRRCHMQGAASLAPGRSFLDFRPSTPLRETVNVFWPRFADSVQSFIMASHPDRLSMSACFKASHRPNSPDTMMTCVTCHNPHVNVKSLDAAYYNGKCATCHTPARQNLCTEVPAVRARNGDNCFACHMPTSGTLDIPHVRITDHYIRKPDRATPAPADPVTERRFFRLASLIDPAPSPAGMADGYLTFFEQFSSHPRYLDSAAVFLNRARAERSDRDLAESLVRLWFLQGDFSAIVSFIRGQSTAGITDPWTLYRIGEAFHKTGDGAAALDYLKRAVDGGPDHLTFLNRLGQAYVTAGEVEMGLSVFDQVLQLHPRYEQALNNRGYVYLMKGQFDRAEKDFLAALALDPDAEQPLANLASLYFNTNRADQARPYARRLLRIAPENPNYRQLWDALP